MREPYGPREGITSPDEREPAVSPERYQPQRPAEHFITQTLAEIQHEQGRQAERSSAQTKSIDKLTDEVRRLADGMLLAKKSIDEFDPKITAHHKLYERVIGASLLISVVMLVAGTMLWYTNSARLDKLIKVLDSPGIESILRKERPR